MTRASPTPYHRDVPITREQILAALLNGALLGIAAIAVAHVLRRDATRFLFAALLVAALLYVVFALSAQAGLGWVAVELVGVVAYGAMGWLGLRRSQWWLAAAWALHPIWDLGLHYPGIADSFAVPFDYPILCVSFDLLVAGYIALRASRGSESATQPTLQTGARESKRDQHEVRGYRDRPSS